MRILAHPLPTVPSGRLFRNHPTLVIMLCALAPIVLISALGWLFAGVLRAVVPVELTNLDALQVVFAGMLHSSIRADSWGPMLQALNVLHGPDRDALYQTLFFTGHVRFQYPPTSLLSVDLLAHLGLGGFRALNAISSVIYLVNTISAGILVWLLFGRQGRVVGPSFPALSRGGMVTIGVVAAFVFYPNMRADVLGQIQVWIDLLFTAAVIAWVLERRLLGGILIGLACSIKPQLGLLLLWGLLWRQWAFSGGMLSSLVPLTAISLFRYGLNAHLGYLQVLSFLSRHGESFFANNSVNGILNGYLSSTNNLYWDALGFTPYNPVIYAGTTAAAVLALAAIVFLPLLSGRRQPGTVDFCIASICTVIGSPVAWEHHYGLLLPIYGVALKCLLDRSAGSGRNLRLACLAASWILVADFIPFANLLARTPFSVLQAHLFLGALVLLALLVNQAQVEGRSSAIGLAWLTKARRRQFTDGRRRIASTVK